MSDAKFFYSKDYMEALREKFAGQSVVAELDKIFDALWAYDPYTIPVSIDDRIDRLRDAVLMLTAVLLQKETPK